MDTDRVPPALLHSEPEGTSPAHAAFGEDTQPDRNLQRTTPRIDSGNLGHSAALSSTSSENFRDTSSLQPLRSQNDHLPQPIPPPSVHLPDLNSEKRNDDNEVDWMVPKEEKVSSVLILNLNRANSFTLIKTSRVEDSQSENVCNLPSTLLSLRRTNVLQKPGGLVLR
jgi:hypothetical protein